MISRINVRLRWLRRKFSRAHWAARLFGLPLPIGETLEPGLIILQVDGLSRTHLEKAIEEGRMPFLRKLIRRHYFSLGNFYSGIPSTTPAVQAEIFFGVKSAVPSFHFLDRKEGKLRRMYEAESATEIEEELMRRCPQPLLSGAHAYSDIYVAGAEESRYCARDLCANAILKHLNPGRLLILALLYSMKILRLIGLSLLELGLALVDVIKGFYRRENFFQELFFVPARVCICCVVRELIRFRVLVDIERGVRLIHANFLGYDEQAHRRGPGSKFAYWTLKGIDRTIRDINRAAHRSGYRDYELIVYSDHGQENAVPYEKLHGRTLAAAVGEVFASGAAAGFPVWTQTMPTVVGNTLDRCRALLHLRNDNQELAGTCDAGQQIVLTAMGPVGHLYLPISLDKEALANDARRLVDEAEVPLVLIPSQGTEIRAFNRHGTWVLPRDGAEVIGREHPFLEEAVEDLVRLCRHPDAGEFVLSGWDPQDPPVTFPLENGAHGGPGCEETRGFVLLPDPVLRSGVVLPEKRPGRFRGVDLKQFAESYLNRDLSLGSISRFSYERRHEEAIRVMTYNVHSCRGMDGKVRPERIARVINRMDPDIVAIQELDAHRDRSGGHDQAREIARHLDMEHVFYDMLAEEREKYGIAVFARFPFETLRTGLLTSAIPGRKEARGAIHLRFPGKGHTPAFHLITTHFGLGREERRRQANVLLGKDWIGAIPRQEPVILCGDFNSSPSSWVWKTIRERLEDAQMLFPQKPMATFSSQRPFLRLDHVFVSGQCSVRRVEVSRSLMAQVASDHLPLCVELTLERNEQAG